MNKFLIVGLGNIGNEYLHTRHNIGFDILDDIATENSLVFELERYAYKSTYRYKGKQIVLIKPTTYMNLSGKAVEYWLKKEKIQTENLLILSDDLHLPIGKIRIRKKGRSGGHNGLQNIEDTLNTTTYNRLRFGVGDDFENTQQAKYVLSKWSEKEQVIVHQKIKIASESIGYFVFRGIAQMMTKYNAL